jgi:hypothetical protein
MKDEEGNVYCCIDWFVMSHLRHGYCIMCWSWWPRDLRRESAAARLLGFWVLIPPGASMSVCRECCVLSSTGLCDGPITFFCLFVPFWHCSIFDIVLFWHCSIFSRSHNDTSQAVGLLWTSDQLVTETSTWQQTTLITHKHPCSGGIRTHNPSRRAAADPRLRQRGHWDRHHSSIGDLPTVVCLSLIEEHLRGGLWPLGLSSHETKLLRSVNKHLNKLYALCYSIYIKCFTQSQHKYIVNNTWFWLHVSVYQTICRPIFIIWEIHSISACIMDPISVKTNKS